METAAVPDEMLRALLGRSKAIAEELTEARRRIESPQRSERPFVPSADVHAEDDEGNGFALVEISASALTGCFSALACRLVTPALELLVFVLRTECSRRRPARRWCW